MSDEKVTELVAPDADPLLGRIASRAVALATLAEKQLEDLRKTPLVEVGPAEMQRLAQLVTHRTPAESSLRKMALAISGMILGRMVDMGVVRFKTAKGGSKPPP